MIRFAASALASIIFVVTPASSGAGLGSSALNGSAARAEVPGVTAAEIKLGYLIGSSDDLDLGGGSGHAGAGLYYRWMRRMGETINGREVRVATRRSRGREAAAKACKELIVKERVFLLVGNAPHLQSVACARVAHRRGVPYLAPGGATAGLRRLPNHFALSMSWRRQGRLLADRAIRRAGRNGIVWVDTPAGREIHRAFIKRFRARGRPVHADVRIGALEGAGGAELAVALLRVNEIRDATLFVSPEIFVQMLQTARAQRYRPEWNGVSSTLAYDSLAPSFCAAGGRETAQASTFLSPWPAFINRWWFDRQFSRATRALVPEQPAGTEHMWALWAQSKIVAQLLELPGRNLTRRSFLRRAEHARIPRDIGSALRFSPERRFPAREFHITWLDCNAEKWRIGGVFVRRF